MDTSIDSEAKANAGLVRGATRVTVVGTYVITAATLDSNNDYSTRDYAILYFFDKKP